MSDVLLWQYSLRQASSDETLGFTNPVLRPDLMLRFRLRVNPRCIKVAQRNEALHQYQPTRPVVQGVDVQVE